MPSGLCFCALERFIKTSQRFHSAGLVSGGLGSISGNDALRAGRPRRPRSGAPAAVGPHGRGWGRRARDGGRGRARAQPAGRGGEWGRTQRPNPPRTVLARAEGVRQTEGSLSVCGAGRVGHSPWAGRGE